jgi:hypothetical protein
MAAAEEDVEEDAAVAAEQEEDEMYLKIQGCQLWERFILQSMRYGCRPESCKGKKKRENRAILL